MAEFLVGMSSPSLPPRRHRAGDTIEDVCRACKADRLHSVIVVDGTGRPLRVQCDYCGSQHNYRGGPEASRGRGAVGPARTSAPATAGGPRSAAPDSHAPGPAEDPRSAFPLVSPRERAREPVMIDGSAEGHADLEMLLRRIFREEGGLGPAVPAEKWRDGMLVLRPANPALQEKSWPIETFFHKVVMIRNRLRTLEQQVNALDLPEDQKIRLQAYITGCYGSLTSFNVLFAHEDDHFKGSGGD